MEKEIKQPEKKSSHKKPVPCLFIGGKCDGKVIDVKHESLQFKTLDKDGEVYNILDLHWNGTCHIACVLHGIDAWKRLLGAYVKSNYQGETLFETKIFHAINNDKALKVNEDEKDEFLNKISRMPEPLRKKLESNLLKQVPTESKENKAKNKRDEIQKKRNFKKARRK